MGENDLTSFNFEDFSKQNGMLWWSAREFMAMLAINDWSNFKKVIDKAIKSCMHAGVEWTDNFTPFKSEDNQDDFKLTRFACYMVAMNGNPNDEKIALAQAYFASKTQEFETYLESEDVARLGLRREFSDGHSSLQSTFKQQGGTDFMRFNQAGVVGLYNQENWKLARKRGIEAKQLYDRMGRIELAANVFRVTQTEAKIDSQQISGQKNLENAHHSVGKAVRDMVIENTGKLPEDLPLADPVKQISKDVKQISKQLKD